MQATTPGTVPLIMKDIEPSYKNLPKYADHWKSELTVIFQPYLRTTDEYGELLVELTLVLGQEKPTSTNNIVVRDLMADAFDFLYEAREALLSGKLNIAYPLMRRAYESISLMSLCILKPSYGDKWEKGQQITNSKIRQELSKHPMGESEVSTKELYGFLSKATHVNRDLIPYRYLGDGNDFVLGAIGRPSILLTLDYAIKHLQLWFWYAAAITWYSNDLTTKEFGQEYLRISNPVKILILDMKTQFNQLLLKEKQSSSSS